MDTHNSTHLFSTKYIDYFFLTKKNILLELLSFEEPSLFLGTFKSTYLFKKASSQFVDMSNKGFPIPTRSPSLNKEKLV